MFKQKGGADFPVRHLDGGKFGISFETRQTEIGEYPSDWKVDRIDSAFEIQQGKHVSKKNRDGDHQRPFLRTKNVFWNRLELNPLPHRGGRKCDGHSLHGLP